MRALRTIAVLDVERESDRDAGDVVEAPLGDLVEGRDRRQRQRDAHRADQLAGTAHALPVAGEVVGQRDLALAVGVGEHHRRLQREQHRRAVTDGRAGAQVAAEGRTVADEPGGELREQLRQQRDVAVEAAFDLGERQGRPDLDVVGFDAQLPQFGQPVDGDHAIRPAGADVHLDAPVGGAGDHHRVGPLAQQLQRLGQGVFRRNALPSWVYSVATGAGGDCSRRCASGSSSVGVTDGERGVANRAVAGAAAQVSAQRVQVEAVRAVLGVGAPSAVGAAGPRARSGRDGSTRRPCCR